MRERERERERESERVRKKCWFKDYRINKEYEK